MWEINYFPHPLTPIRITIILFLADVFSLHLTSVDIISRGEYHVTNSDCFIRACPTHEKWTLSNESAGEWLV